MFLLPILGELYVASRYSGDLASTVTVVVLAGAALGIAIGYASGALVRVWRDEASGLVYQCGGWRYAGVFVGLIALRVLMRAVLGHGAIALSTAALNDAFIAMAIGAYLGRSLNIGLRAMTLLGWQAEALPSRRELRQSLRRLLARRLDLDRDGQVVGHVDVGFVPDDPEVAPVQGRRE